MVSRYPEKSTIFSAFMKDAAGEFSRALNTDRLGRSSVSRALRINHLFPVIDETAHFAQWRAVGREYMLLGGDVRRSIGIDVKLGRNGGGVSLRYFPRIPGPTLWSTEQFPALHVWGRRAYMTGPDELNIIDVSLKKVVHKNHGIGFLGSILDRYYGRFTELWLEPDGFGEGGYAFRLARGASDLRLKRDTNPYPHTLPLWSAG